MFAVVILGIGFILVAAIFPVAIQQSQATNEESSAAAIARIAASAIAAQASTIPNPNVPTPTSGLPIADPSQTVQTIPLFPPTVKNYVPGNFNIAPTSSSSGQVSVPPRAVFVPLTGARYEAIKGNTILPSDPRYAWTAFYSRENGSSQMTLIVIAMASRQHPVYNPLVDTVSTVTASTAVTQRYFVTAPPANIPNTQGTSICPDVITLSGGSAAEGWTVGTSTAAAAAQISGKPAGRYYTLGRQLSTASSFELMPGGDMSLTAGAGGLWGLSGGITDKQLVGDPVNIFSPTNLQVTVAYAALRADPNSPGGRIFLTTSLSSAAPPPAAATGAFVVVADDYAWNPTQNPAQAMYQLPPNLIPAPKTTGLTNTNQYVYSVGSVNGRVFRLGKPITEDFEQGIAYPPGTFDIDPQYGMRPPTVSQNGTLYSGDSIPSPVFMIPASPIKNFAYGNPNTVPPTMTPIAKVYIVGMGKDDQGNYGKDAQDIGVFTTIVPVQ
jgi:hypothetical protein